MRVPRIILGRISGAAVGPARLGLARQAPSRTPKSRDTRIFGTFRRRGTRRSCESENERGCDAGKLRAESGSREFGESIHAVSVFRDGGISGAASISMRSLGRGSRGRAPPGRCCVDRSRRDSFRRRVAVVIQIVATSKAAPQRVASSGDATSFGLGRSDVRLGDRWRVVGMMH